MIVNLYDPDTGYFTEQYDAQESPETPGEYIAPEHSTPIALPNSQPNKWPKFNLQTKKSWKLVDNYVGFQCWLADGTEINITELEVAPPVGFLTNKPFVLLSKQTDAKSRISNGCALTIESGVHSDVLGSDHLYPTAQADQSNINGLVTATLLFGTGDAFKFWCADSNGIWERRVHTAEQIQTVGKTILNHVKTNQDKYELKLSEINTAKTQDQLDAVVW